MNTKVSQNKTAIVAFRTRQDIKDKVGRILERSGLDTSTVLNVFMQSIASSGKSPLSLDRAMSPKLIKRIESVEREDITKRKSFDSTKEAIAFLKNA